VTSATCLEPTLPSAAYPGCGVERIVTRPRARR
jgi:hypothetical protein